MWAADLRAAGTLRLMFSSASRRSTWKSGWRKVQLCVRGKKRGQKREEAGRALCTHVLAKLVVVRVLDLREWEVRRSWKEGEARGGDAYLVEVVLVELADERGKIGVLEHAGEDGLCELVHVLDDEAVAVGSPGDDM